MSSQHCLRVKPRSRAYLRQAATHILSYCGLSGPRVPVVEILEHHLAKLGVVYEYMPQSSMGTDHGRSYPDTGIVQIREDVYERACAGEGRDRFTVAHEIGHVVLHAGLSLQRTAVPLGPIRPYESSEWQANAFAGELLMPLHWLRAHCRVPHDLVSLFGVSETAARTQWNALCREGVLKPGVAR